jgi:benzil reductase ((S)-benzoin forming)
MTSPFVITGGGSGIGEALALELSKQGETVIIIGRRQSPLETTKAKAKGTLDIIQADVGSDQGRHTIKKALADYPSIKGLVHNAGVVTPIEPITNLTLTKWRQTQAINVEAPLFLTQTLLDQLEQQKVVHISSGARSIPLPAWAPYCTSKAALYMLWQCFKQELPTINFASVRPGIVNTPMMDTIRHNQLMPEPQRDFYQTLYDNEQLVSPEMVAKFISWLLLEVDSIRFNEQEWDIYDTTHHHEWAQGFKIPELPV